MLATYKYFGPVDYPMIEVFSNTCSRLARGPAADEGVCPTLNAAVANPLSDEHWG